MSREGVALPGTGAPAQEYDRMNEAQYRAAVEQALARLSAAIREIEELSDDLTITGAWTFDPGPVVIGTDPGSSESLRVGGSGKVRIEDDAAPQIRLEESGESKTWHLEVSGSDFRIVETGVAVQAEFAAGGNVLLHNLPTSDPTVAGALWNDSGTLKVSSG